MQPFDFIKSLVLNFKFDSCCWIAPVRVGLIVTGFFNAIVATVSLIGTANDSIITTLTHVQTSINEDAVTKSAPMFAYITEIGFSVICLCGIYRKDLVLLRVYMYYCVAALIMSIMVYSIVILAIDVLIQITILAGIVFQIYVLLLVRSAIVEIKWENKKSQLPTLLMSTLIKEKEILNEHVSNNLELIDQEVKIDKDNEENVNNGKDQEKVNNGKDIQEVKVENSKDCQENVKNAKYNQEQIKNSKDKPEKVKRGKDKEKKAKPGKNKPEEKKDHETITVEASVTDHEVKTDVEKAMEPEEKKNDHKVEVKLETVNEEVVS